MTDKRTEMASSLEQAQTELRESFDSARKLVERTRFLLRGEPDSEQA
jgi:hypothetical protein